VSPNTPELEARYLAIPYSTVAMLVGLIDGDGMFDINRVNNAGNIKVGMKLALHERDLPLLQQLQSLFGIGTITGPHLTGKTMTVK